MTSSSETSLEDEIAIVSDLSDLGRLFELMGTYGIAMVEIGKLKVMRPPDVAATAVKPRESAPERRVPGAVHEDPFLYPDGAVPSFGS